MKQNLELRNIHDKLIFERRAKAIQHEFFSTNGARIVGCPHAKR